MSSGQRLSRNQKGKAVATSASPARDVDGNPLDDFGLVHREAMMDTVNMRRFQRLLVANAARLMREGGDNLVTSDARDCPGYPQGGERVIDSIFLRNRSTRESAIEPEFAPTCYFPGGIFEGLPRIHPDLLRPADAENQSWDNVEKTRSTPASVRRLFRECRAIGAIFLIPTATQRPWYPPFTYKKYVHS